MKHDILEADKKPLELNATQLRAQGIIPCVLFGENEESIPIAIKEGLLAKGLKTGHKIFQVKFNGTQYLVNIDSVQRHPVTRRPLHVSFHRIRMNEKTTVSVPIHFVGHPVGEKDGGILVHQMTQVDAIALPSDIPEFVTIDVTDLAMGDSKHVSDIAKIPGVEFDAEDMERVVCTCTAPKAEKVAAPAPVEGEEGAAPSEAPAADTEKSE